MVLDTHPRRGHHQLDSLVLLRAVAVLLVCTCHFGKAVITPQQTSLFFLFDQLGKYGVYIFFVISGFVIPLSLYKGKYAIGDYPFFVFKRFLRLHPPYLAALLLTLAVGFLSAKWRHLPFNENWQSMLASVFYVHMPADNPSFWTLAVEAQYYLFIGVFYTLLVRRNAIAYFVVMPLLLSLVMVLSRRYFILQPFFSMFFIGNVACMLFAKIGRRTLHKLVLLLLLVYTATVLNTTVLLASAIALAFIFYYKQRVPASLAFVGNISYSVYLVHFPIGVKCINLLKPAIAAPYHWCLMVVALVITLLASWLFFKMFEVASEKYSKKYLYKRALQPAATSPVLAPVMLAK